MSWEFCIRSSPTLYKYVHVNVIAKKPRIKLIITVCYLYHCMLFILIHKQGAVSVKWSSLYKIKNVHASLV